MSHLQHNTLPSGGEPRGTAIIIFVKNPEPGKVKTRLAKDIGDEAALSVYRQLLDHTRAITEGLDADKYLYYGDYLNWNDAWDFNTYRKRLQAGADLGARMESAFREVRADGYGRVLIIGSDCYELSEAIIKEAFELLAIHDAVIGPALDGGYYLLGLKQDVPALFRNIAWSTDAVYQSTLQVFQEMGISCGFLPPLQDIDTVENLRHSGLSF